jgi:signal transduction histidine kinase
MLRTLYAKLAVVLLLLFCAVGGISLLAALYSAHLYQQEVAQRLNRDLASHIVNEHVLLQDNVVNQAGLEDLFHNLMIINPSLELYLLGPDGRILSYSAAPGKIVREQVDLAPLQRLQNGSASLPVLGDDPRQSDGQKAFSVAPVVTGGELQGYIYAILGSEQVEHIADLLRNSFIMRWSALAAGAALVFSLAAGLLVFALLTRRLRRLSDSMEAFKRQNFSAPITYLVNRDEASDEIDRLAITFFEMSVHIRSQMERLRETDALRRELVANVSHDLRTPLASLQGYLETLLLKDATLSAEERRGYLETARRHATHLTTLVFELFELAKLDARELQPKREPFPLTELVHDVTQKFQLRAQQQQVRIEAETSAETPFVDADIGMIERVLDNLIDNALRHTSRGDRIHITLADNHDRVAVRVSDSGAGIPTHELPHIFDRFYRKSSGGTVTDSYGAGLGLAIAQRIVELHGGKISVESRVNRGTEFGFSLPAYPGARA